MPNDEGQQYLIPYLRAAAEHGAGFKSLLWASPDTQAARFNAFARLWGFAGQSVLDVGCGRADFLEFLTGRGIVPADYIGIEAVAELADAAKKRFSTSAVRSTLLRADFVREPARMFVGADVTVFSGSLNTLPDESFYETLRFAWDATAGAVVFNFLDSPNLAGASYLAWRRRADVRDFAVGLTGNRARVKLLHGYLDGDCTIALGKP
jgi:hypothetical protein